MVLIKGTGDNDIWFHCEKPHCGFRWAFREEELTGAFGPEVTAQELKRDFVCLWCRSHGASITLSFTGYTGIR